MPELSLGLLIATYVVGAAYAASYTVVLLVVWRDDPLDKPVPFLLLGHPLLSPAIASSRGAGPHDVRLYFTGRPTHRDAVRLLGAALVPMLNVLFIPVALLLLVWQAARRLHAWWCTFDLPQWLNQPM